MKEIFNFKTFRYLFWSIVAIGFIFFLMFYLKYFFIPDKLVDGAMSFHFLIFSLVFYLGLLSFLFYFIYFLYQILKLALENELKKNEFDLQTQKNSNDKSRFEAEIRLKQAASDYNNAKDFIKFISELNKDSQLYERIKDDDINVRLQKIIEAYKKIH